jgi:hypothetical protein
MTGRHPVLHQGGLPHCEARGCAVLCGQQSKVGRIKSINQSMKVTPV